MNQKLENLEKKFNGSLYPSNNNNKKKSSSKSNRQDLNQNLLHYKTFYKLIINK